MSPVLQYNQIQSFVDRAEDYAEWIIECVQAFQLFFADCVWQDLSCSCRLKSVER